MNSIPEHIKEHAAIVRANAAEGALFLKKDGSFPLAAAGRLALFGNGARNTVKGGTGSGNVYCMNFNSCEQALEDAGFTVTTKAWLDAYDKERARAHEAWFNEKKKAAGKDGNSLFLALFGIIHGEEEYCIPLDGDGDACLYVLSRNSGEGMDRVAEKGSVFLTDTEVRDILALNEKFEEFMLVLNVGGVVDLTPVNGVKNILLLSQLGVATGDVLADIVLGKADPTGKLAATWARFEDYPAIGDFGEKDDTRYKEGVYVGYRYFDTAEKQPLYPFGFGLSYTDFTVTPAGISNQKSKILVQAKVKNVGSRAGKEVVEVYVVPPRGKIAKPLQALAAFRKTAVAAGEEETVSLSFDLASLASYDEKAAAFVLEAGDYIVRVGNSSRNTQAAGVVVLREDVVTERVKNALGKPDFEDAILPTPAAEVSENVPKLCLFSADLTVKTHDYKIDEHVNAVIKDCTDEQLMHLCVGAYLPKAKLSVLGSSACHVCGASGETTNYAPEVTKGKYLVLADGPAGLRITLRYVETESGKRTVHDKLDPLLASLPEPMKKQLIMLDQVKEEDLHYQLTTAIPIGTAIAQTWDPDVAAVFGDIVGAECERYGCHFWLAPAMNIQRNILCGRNFEYYSEDPLVTGKTAAGIVCGLQKHRHIGATIKHFCANNQETNRYNNNSVVSERTMREIYLKGFEICVKESAPKAVMTSYNLLNGEHTSQRGDLLDGILRGEWGYRGFVMTDWVTTNAVFDATSKHPGVFAHKVIGAGNDLMTPGGDADFEDLQKAFAEGTLSREKLEICATRVYEAIMENND